MQRLKEFPLFLLFAAVACLPLVYSELTLDPVLMPRFTVLAMATALSALGIFFLKPQFDPLKLPIFSALFLLVFLASAVLASSHPPAPSEALFSFGKDLLMVLFLFIFAGLLTTNHLHYLPKAVVISAAFLLTFVGYDWWQMQDSQEALATYEITGRMGHRNLLASALVFTLPFSSFVGWHSSKAWKISGALISLTSIAAVVVLQSRGAILGMAAFLITFAILAIWRKLGSPRILKALTIAGLGISIFLIACFFYLRSNPKIADVGLWKDSQISAGTAEQEFTAQERLLMWKATVQMIFDQPLKGVGAGHWKIHFPKYSGDIWRARQGMVQFQRPHNDFLWILSEQGIFGLAAFLLFLGSIFSLGLKVLLRQTNDKQNSDLTHLLLAGIGAYLCVSFFSFPRERIVHQVLLFSSIASLLVLAKPGVPETKISGITKRISATIFLLLLLPISAIGYSRYRGEYTTQQLLKARAAGNWKTLLEHYNHISSSLFYQLDPTAVPMEFYAGLAHLNLNQPEMALEYFEDAHEKHPYNIHVINNLAGTHQLLAHPQMAIEYYGKALEIAPYYIDGVLNFTAAYFNANEVHRAYDVLLENKGKFRYGANEKYNTYLLTILYTIRANLMEEMTDPKIKESLMELKEEEILRISERARQQDIPITEAMLEATH